MFIARDLGCVSESEDAFRALQKAIWGEGGVPRWNDAPERTKDEVTSTMRAVAATLRAKETAEIIAMELA